MNKTRYDIKITKKDLSTITVYLMQNKSDETWTYVNITKNHICPCRFPTIAAAIQDLEERDDIEKYEILKVGGTE